MQAPGCSTAATACRLPCLAIAASPCRSRAVSPLSQTAEPRTSSQIARLSLRVCPHTAGTGPEVFGNTNAPPAVTYSAIIYALRCMVPQEIPLNQVRHAVCGCLQRCWLPANLEHLGTCMGLVSKPKTPCCGWSCPYEQSTLTLLCLQGCLTPITIKIPAGSMLSPSSNAAVVGGNVLTSQRITDVVLKAFTAAAASQVGTCLSQISSRCYCASVGLRSVQDSLGQKWQAHHPYASKQPRMASLQGCMNNFTFGDSQMGYYETICGGAGAGPGWHGRSGVHTHMTNTRWALQPTVCWQHVLDVLCNSWAAPDTTICVARQPACCLRQGIFSHRLWQPDVLPCRITDPEILERRYPVVLHQFILREGSGGAGKFRGGDGIIREVARCCSVER